MADTDELTYTGLQTKDNTVLVEELKRDLQDLYSVNGEELNFESNTPDGQLVEIIAFLGTTLREMITEVYNSCDPDKCVGAIQDNRYQINYLNRKAGSYTIQEINITTNKTVTLQGLDASYNDTEAAAYTVSDNNGNIWYLMDTTTITSGTTRLSFRAKELGQIIPTIGTITNPVTIVDGVLRVINNVGPLDIGVDEESDSDFRIRREQSTAKSGKNNIDTIIAELLELQGVTSVKTHENKGSEEDSTGTPAHTAWIAVKGGGNEDIAKIIYANSGGAGTRGDTSVTINSESQQPITINFDRAIVVPLYIKFSIQPITDPGEINIEEIKKYIVENLTYDLGENVETSKITAICADAMLSDGGNGYALNIQISTGGTATASIGNSTGITSATVDVIAFQYTVQDVSGTYVFIYNTDHWELNTEVVNLEQYGITYEGTPNNSDNIEIDYTASTWTDYLIANSIRDEFVTDANKIYITIIE